MASAETAQRLAFDRFVIDRADERLIGDSGPIRIGHKAWCVLDTLIAADGRLVTKDELFDCGWDGAAVSESALTSVIKELRRALGDDRHDPRFIESVYGRGYRFLAEVRAAGDAPAPPPPTPPVASPALGLLAPAPRRRRTRWWLPVALVALLVIGVIGWRFGPDLRTRLAGEPEAARVAVMPFGNIGGRADEAYFAEGVTEELRGRLSRLPQLELAARMSSGAVHDQRLDAKAIGQRLGVRYVIDGSVRRAGDVVRVSATLIDTRTGFQRWTQSYDRQLNDIFAIQGDIAQAVASAVQGRLAVGQAALLSGSQTRNPAAFDAYARGRAQFDLSAGEATYRSALANFDRAIALDRQYALAWAQRSRVLAVIANQYGKADQLRGLYAESLASARQAIALSPNLAEAQVALGYVLVNGYRNFAAARAPYQRAAILGANNADILIPCGIFAVRSGDAKAGIAELRRAAALDPLNPRTFHALGIGLFSARDYAGAVPQLRRALALSPTLNSGHAAVGDALLMLGRPAEALSEYEREPQAYTRLTGVAIAEARLGRRDKARAAFDELVARSGDAVAYQRAQVLAQWGNADAAFAALDRARAVGDSGLVKLPTDPLLDPLRRDARYQPLLARLGFPA